MLPKKALSFSLQHHEQQQDRRARTAQMMSLPKHSLWAYPLLWKTTTTTSQIHQQAEVNTTQNQLQMFVVVQTQKVGHMLVALASCTEGKLARFTQTSLYISIKKTLVKPTYCNTAVWFKIANWCSDIKSVMFNQSFIFNVIFKTTCTLLFLIKH